MALGILTDSIQALADHKHMLEEAAKRVEAAGVQGEWIDVHKIGRAYRFTGPWGHTLTLHWDVTRHHDTEGEAASIYPDRPSRRQRRGCG